jgi:hypothetical protein
MSAHERRDENRNLFARVYNKHYKKNNHNNRDTSTRSRGELSASLPSELEPVSFRSK